jgi:hypothetical protein
MHHDHLMNTRLVTFDNDKDIHISSRDYEENGYVHDLELLIILH